MDANESIFKRILDDNEFQQQLLELVAERAYGKLKEDKSE